MAAAALKIIVSGDVEGKFEALFKRVALIDKKSGPFDMLLCVGSFFGDDNSEWESIISGKLKAPVSTYILGPCRPEHAKYFPDPKGGDVAPNITYLGKKGLFTGSSGLKLAYLSGIEGSSEASHIFTVKDAADLQTNFSHGSSRGVDILLTSQWPRGITKYAGTPENIDPFKCGSELVSKIAVLLKPRYHLCGLEGVFYERLPYRNHQILVESSCHITRFISLAKVGNAGKQKWVYAFSISPMRALSTAELSKQPPTTTECPYSMNTVANTGEDDASSQFFYDLSKSSEGQKRKHKESEKSGKHKQSKVQALETCWFCLTSKEVEKHLVVSIGETCYVALAKGGLTPDHILILPNCHYQSVIELPDDELREMKQFKVALQKFFKTRDKCVVFFERNYKSPHLQIQVVPVPLKFKPRLKEIFIDYAESQSIELDEIPATTELKEVMTSKRPYFCVEIGSAEKLLCKVQNNFPLQFGREVLASPPLLNIPHRADWKACTLTKEEETQLSKKFQKDFAPFDFTLE